MVEAAIAAGHKASEQALTVLERWVRQNSYSANIANVNKMGELLAEDFAMDGLSLTRYPGEGVGDHLFFKTPAWDADKGKGAVLVGHHDTVFPPGAFEKWEVRDNGELSGPGVLDMKGGLVVIHSALRALSDIGALASTPIAFVCVADEEIGSPHSKELSLKLCQGAGAVLVFEGGRQKDMVITQRKGTGAIKVEAVGKAAHAGNHHREGQNAIRLLSRFIDRVEELTDYDRGTTVNVGLVSGGEARNTVPSHAECGIDFRFEEADAGPALVAAVKELAETVSQELEGKLEVSGGVRRPPWGESDANLALYERYAKGAEAAGLGRTKAPLLGGGSDGNHLAAAGLAVIDGMGPRGLGFHTHNEKIEIATIAQKIEALVRFLVST